MKKFACFVMAALFLMALGVTGAQAAGYVEVLVGAPSATGLDLKNAGDNSPIVVPLPEVTVTAEKMTAAYQLDFNGPVLVAARRTIIYSSSTDLAAGAQIWFKLTNAKWDIIKNIYLIGADDAVPGNFKGDALVYGTSDAYVDENGTANPAYCKIVLGNNITAGQEFYLHYAATAPNDVDNLAGWELTIVPPTVINNGMTTAAGQTATLSVTKATFAGGDIVGARATARTVIKTVSQFTWVLGGFGVATSTIDVDPADANDRRKVFVDEGNPGVDTPDDQTSVLLDPVFTDNAGTINDPVTLDANDTLTVYLVAQYNWSDFINGGANAPDVWYDLNNNAGVKDAGESFGIDANDSKMVKLTYAATLGASTQGRDIYVKVNGTTVLNPQNITAKVDIYLKDENATVTLFTTQNAFVWGINGALVVVPEFTSDPKNTGTRIMVTNTSDTSAEISGDVYTNGGATVLFTGVTFGTVPAKSTVVLDPGGIQDKINTKAGGNIRNAPFSVTTYLISFVVTAPTDNVFFNAYKKEGAVYSIKVPCYKWTAKNTDTWNE